MWHAGILLHFFPAVLQLLHSRTPNWDCKLDRSSSNQGPFVGFKWVKFWKIGWPFLFTNEVGQLSSAPLAGKLGSVGWSSVLLEGLWDVSENVVGSMFYLLPLVRRLSTGLGQFSRLHRRNHERLTLASDFLEKHHFTVLITTFLWDITRWMFLSGTRTFWLLRDGFIVKNFLIRENDEGLRVITQVDPRLSAFFGPTESIEIGIGT